MAWSFFTRSRTRLKDIITESRHMNMIAIKSLLTMLMIFSVIHPSIGQIIKEDGKEITLDPDTKIKVEMLVDSLTGTWELIKTIRYENGDTIIQKPSTKLWLTPEAKPFTTIRIDSLRNFEIEQECMKCPYLFWKGIYEVEIRTFQGLGLFYVNFVYERQMKMKKKEERSMTLEFGGYLTNFENGELSLTNKDGVIWIYKRH